MTTIRIQCQSCRGTGLYSGMGEDDHCAVVCHTCRGSGESSFTYEEFTGRQAKPGIRWVYLTNPGIKVGGPNPGRFGGMPASRWARGEPFPSGSENRKCTCPAWWYQSADYKRKPDWKECNFGIFSACEHFGAKEKCWARWDREQEKP